MCRSYAPPHHGLASLRHDASQVNKPYCEWHLEGDFETRKLVRLGGSAFTSSLFYAEIDWDPASSAQMVQIEVPMRAD